MRRIPGKLLVLAMAGMMWAGGLVAGDAVTALAKSARKLAARALQRQGVHSSNYRVSSYRVSAEKWVVNYCLKAGVKAKTPAWDYKVFVNVKTHTVRVSRGAFLGL